LEQCSAAGSIMMYSPVSNACIGLYREQWQEVEQCGSLPGYYSSKAEFNPLENANNGFVAVKTIKSSNNFPIALAIFCVLFFSSAASSQEQEWLSYYPAVSRLQGKLTKISKFGKPTYGENPESDEKVEVFVLILQTPVRLKARPTSSVNNESVTNVSFVQVIFPPEVGGNSSKHLDKDIVVAGTLVRGHKGEHFTDVVMTVKAVNPTGKPM